MSRGRRKGAWNPPQVPTQNDALSQAPAQGLVPKRASSAMRSASALTSSASIAALSSATLATYSADRPEAEGSKCAVILITSMSKAGPPPFCRLT